MKKKWIALIAFAAVLIIAAIILTTAPLMSVVYYGSESYASTETYYKPESKNVTVVEYLTHKTEYDNEAALINTILNYVNDYNSGNVAQLYDYYYELRDAQYVYNYTYSEYGRMNLIRIRSVSFSSDFTIATVDIVYSDNSGIQQESGQWVKMDGQWKMPYTQD